MKFINPYTEEDYKIFEKMYIDNLFESYLQFYESMIKIVFGK